MDVGCGCGLCGRWILVEWEWMFDFGCMDIGFCLCARWILNAWTLKFYYLDVAFSCVWWMLDFIVV